MIEAGGGRGIRALGLRCGCQLLGPLKGGCRVFGPLRGGCRLLGLLSGASTGRVSRGFVRVVSMSLSIAGGGCDLGPVAICAIRGRLVRRKPGRTIGRVGNSACASNLMRAGAPACVGSARCAGNSACAGDSCLRPVCCSGGTACWSGTSTLWVWSARGGSVSVLSRAFALANSMRFTSSTALTHSDSLTCATAP